MITVIAVLITILIMLCIFFALDRFTNIKGLTSQFKKSQKAALVGLTKKKEAYEKEMTTEIQEKISALKKESSILNQKNEQVKADYQKSLQQLSNEYLVQKRKYDTLKDSDARKRNEAIQNEIIKEQANKQKQFSEIQEDYNLQKEKLEQDFFLYSESINSQKETLKKELKKYEDRQKEIISRFQKDEEVRQQRDFYHISISQAAKADIAKLKQLALEFSRSEVLYKVIYEFYYKNALEELFKRVLGNFKDEGGIYKITNIYNEKAYIGRTTNFLSRFRTHSKRGCGLEKISGQLYEAMFEEGLENFSFEIIEVCDKEEQPEKEKYWTDFYHSDQYGYNIRVG